MEVESKFEVTAEDVKNGGAYIMVSITPHEVNNKIFSHFEKTLSALEGAGADARDKLWMTFAYDSDPRGIYAIPEIRAWVMELFRAHPHLFYFISEMNDSRAAILACLGNRFEGRLVKTSYGPIIGLAFALPHDIREQVYEAIRSYGKLVDDSKKNINKIIESIESRKV